MADDKKKTVKAVEIPLKIVPVVEQPTEEEPVEPQSPADIEDLLRRIRRERMAIVEERLAAGAEPTPQPRRIKEVLATLQDINRFLSRPTAPGNTPTAELENYRAGIAADQAAVSRRNQARRFQGLDKLDSILKERKADLEKFRDEHKKRAREFVDLIERDPDAAEFAFTDPDPTDDDPRSRFERALDLGKELGFKHREVEKRMNAMIREAKAQSASIADKTRPGGEVAERNAARSAALRIEERIVDDLGRLQAAGEDDSEQAKDLQKRLNSVKESAPQFGEEDPQAWDNYRRELLGLQQFTSRATTEVSKATKLDKETQSRRKEINDNFGGRAAEFIENFDKLDLSNEKTLERVYNESLQYKNEFKLVQKPLADAREELDEGLLFITDGVKNEYAPPSGAAGSRVTYGFVLGKAREVMRLYVNASQTDRSNAGFDIGSQGDYGKKLVDEAKNKARLRVWKAVLQAMRDARAAGMLEKDMSGEEFKARLMRILGLKME